SRQLASAYLLSPGVCIWDVDSSNRKPQVLPHGSMCTGVAFGADGQRLAVADYGARAALWEPASGTQLLEVRDLPANALCVRFSPDANHLAASCSDGSVRVWDATPLAGAGDESLLTLHHPGGLMTLDISPTTNWLACAGSSHSNNIAPVQIWET